MTTAHDTSLPTLFDLAKIQAPGGGTLPVIEALQKRSPLLQDAVFVTGNMETGHKIRTRTALPNIAWRKMNEGVPRSKSKSATVVETCGQLAGQSAIDEDMVSLNGGAAYRADEDKAFINQFNNTAEEAAFYSSAKTDPEQVHGLIPRLDSLSGPYGDQIVNSQIASTDADQTSVLFVCWSPQTVHGIVPKGLPGGLKSQDMGKQLIPDDAGNSFVGYVTDFKWNMGWAVPDARYLVRLANIDTSAISKSDTKLLQDLVTTRYRMRDFNSGRYAWYANRLICEYLHHQAIAGASNVRIEEVMGQPVLMLFGAPVRMTDALLNTEAIVT